MRVFQPKAAAFERGEHRLNTPSQGVIGKRRCLVADDNQKVPVIKTRPRYEQTVAQYKSLTECPLTLNRTVSK